MSAEYRLVAERLIAFWKGSEEVSPWCQALAERLEPGLRTRARRSPETDLRQDPAALASALSAFASVDPATRDLVRKLAPLTGEAAPDRGSTAPAGNRLRSPGPAAPAAIHVRQNNGMVVGGDLSVSGGLVFSPTIQGAPSAPMDREEARRLADPIRILFLGANPQDTTKLRLDQEVRDITSALRQARYRESFDLRQQWAVRVSDLQRALLEHQPQILHFSGHGSRENALYLEDDSGAARPVSGLALAQLLVAFKEVRCVVLNACYSQGQAMAIAEKIDCVVGMSIQIGDEAAICFATSFYQALGYGRDVQSAFDLGCNEILLRGLGEEATPRLHAVRCDPSEVVFARSSREETW